MKICKKFWAMKFFGKIIVPLALASGASSVYAERSGAFVGAEIGIGGGEAKSSYYKCQNTDQTKPECHNPKQGSERLVSGEGVDYGFVAGYKLFITRYFGLRAYANVNVAHLALEAQESKDSQAQKLNATALKYGANVDFLANFMISGESSLGGFLGFGMGANTWLGKDLGGLRGIYEANFSTEEIALLQGLKRNITGFVMSLNVGLRGTLNKHHGIEFAFRWHFWGSRAFYERYDEYGLQKDATGNNAQPLTSFPMRYIEANTTLYNPYSLSLRYTYSF